MFEAVLLLIWRIQSRQFQRIGFTRESNLAHTCGGVWSCGMAHVQRRTQCSIILWQYSCVSTISLCYDKSAKSLGYWSRLVWTTDALKWKCLNALMGQWIEEMQRTKSLWLMKHLWASPRLVVMQFMRHFDCHLQEPWVCRGDMWTYIQMEWKCHWFESKWTQMHLHALTEFPFVPPYFTKTLTNLKMKFPHIGSSNIIAFFSWLSWALGYEIRWMIPMHNVVCTVVSHARLNCRSCCNHINNNKGYHNSLSFSLKCGGDRRTFVDKAIICNYQLFPKQ